MTDLPLYPIADLLPHRPPMLLLDAVVARDAETLTARVVPRPDMPFFVAGQGMPAHAALEWMAQCCGAFVGARALDTGGAARIGFLLGSRNFQCQVAWFAAGMALDIVARLLFLDGSMGVFDCWVRPQGHETGADLASARLTVYQPPDTGSETV